MYIKCTIKSHCDQILFAVNTFRRNFPKKFILRNSQADIRPRVLSQVSLILTLYRKLWMSLGFFKILKRPHWDNQGPESKRQKSRLKLPLSLPNCFCPKPAGLANGHGMGASNHVPPPSLRLQHALGHRAHLPCWPTRAGLYTLSRHHQDQTPTWVLLAPCATYCTYITRATGCIYPAGQLVQAFTLCPDNIKIRHLLGSF